MANPDIPFSRPRRGNARQAILDATHALVRRQGWSATSIDQICGEAGVTKGAFFHHFASKEYLGTAAAQHWTEVTAPLFASAPFTRLSDPLDRVFGYLDFRAAIADGPLEAVTCFAGTTVQETFASSASIRDACGQSIADHAATLVPHFAAAIEQYPPRYPVNAESLALYTQSVLQGSFVVAKASNDTAPIRDATVHLKNHLALLFGKEPLGGLMGEAP